MSKIEKKPKEAKEEAAPEAKEVKQPSKNLAKETEAMDKPGYKGIVRLAGKDIRGHVKLKRALQYVRGIGKNLGPAVALVLNKELSLPSDFEIGYLTDEQIEKIDKILFNLHDHDLPKFLLNRRSDFMDGGDKHGIMNDLIFTSKQDVEREKKLFTWKGYRHQYGQKVRGQRTRNTGRTGMAVGVLRKSIIGAAAAGGAGAPAGGTAAPAGGAKAASPAGGAAPKAAVPAAGAKAAPAGGAAKTEAKK